MGLLALSSASGAAAAAGNPCSSGRPPVSVFAGLEGPWEGSFVGFDLEGREIYRIAVRQLYRTVDEETQEVEIEDRMADGSVVRGRGENVARCLPDGRLELRCRVTKSNGDRVEHVGRLATGADGRSVLVWSSSKPGRRESFREATQDDRYTIDGVGIYGDEVILVEGRYRRIGGAPP